jgi:hypothetical protein
MESTKRLFSWFGGWAAVEGGDRFVAQTAVLLAMTGTGGSFIQSGGSHGRSRNDNYGCSTKPRRE